MVSDALTRQPLQSLHGQVVVALAYFRRIFEAGCDRDEQEEVFTAFRRNGRVRFGGGADVEQGFGWPLRAVINFYAVADKIFVKEKVVVFDSVEPFVYAELIKQGRRRHGARLPISVRVAAILFFKQLRVNMVVIGSPDDDICRELAPLKGTYLCGDAIGNTDL